MNDRILTSNPRVHELKCWPEFFVALENGTQTFDVRRNDRSFHVGDTLVFREWIHALARFTGHELRCTVSYVLSGPVFGLMDGWVVMGLHSETRVRCGWFGEGRGQCLLYEGHEKHPQTRHHTCEEDGRLLDAERRRAGKETPASPNDAFRWICPKCTTVNDINDAVCCVGSCKTPRPLAKAGATLLCQLEKAGAP